jgi:proteasome lid subunit RPN8/RPN11
VVLSHADCERLRRLAQDALPAEACALLIGADTPDGRVVRRVARAGEGDRTGFAIPAAAFYAAEQRAQRSGDFVCGVFHSHPASRAVPSGRDLELAWPGLDYVILDARTGELRAWRLTEDRSRFVATPLDVERT